jgi:hypothetical protein
MNCKIYVCAMLLAVGCGSANRGYPTGKGGKGHNGGMGSMNIPGCDPSKSTPNSDQDSDGYTPAQGDCNDCNASINPGAIQIPGDSTDYACNGMPGVLPACDSGLAGARDATSLAKAFDQCDPRFFKGAMLVGPSDQRARKVLGKFGVVQPRAGQSMALISSGIAADKSDPDFDKVNEEDPGTDLGGDCLGANSYANPLPNLPGVAGCSQTQPPTVNDYTELVVRLTAPTNVSSFSFDFQFLSAEYPFFVCTPFNDEFLVLQESQGEFNNISTNIAFDMQKNPITVNNGFFTVCQNDTSKPQTQHCTQPLTQIAGTGFEDPPVQGMTPLCEPYTPQTKIPGGATGWLTTTSPVTPREDVTLHFIIFDEGDHILDSAALIDNFRWGTSVVSAPQTNPIQ